MGIKKVLATGAQAGVFTKDLAAAKALAKNTGKDLIVLVGKSSGCAYCNAAYGLIFNTAAFADWAKGSGLPLVYADCAAATYEPWATVARTWRVSGSIPVCLVIDGRNGKTVKGQFVVREVAWGFGALTPKNFARKVADVCPSCAVQDGACADGSCSVPATPATPATKTCPTCKGTGKVLALVALLLTMACGCVVTRGSFKPPSETDKTPEVTFWRGAFFYPFEVESVLFPGGVGIAKYKTSGGGPELVPVFDSAGKLLGYMAGSAVNAAVK